MQAFLDMGGYGFYVWTAYGFALLAMLGLLAQSIRLARRRTLELERLRQRGRDRQRRPAPVLRPVRESAAHTVGEES